MFTQDDRERVFDRLIELARHDARLTGAASIGSTSYGWRDGWSDIDLGLGVATSANFDEVVLDWTNLVDYEFGALHHFDVWSRATLYRVFLLSSGLEIDLSFSPAEHFGPRGPAFRLLFGSAESPASIPTNVNEVMGLGWLFLFHAHAAIEREKYWRAEYFISAARDQLLTLACLRLGEETVDARGFDRLPIDVTAPIERSLVKSLAPSDLSTALTIVARGLLQEISIVDHTLSTELRTLLMEVCGWID
jgi:hypothetical protein